MKRKRNVIWGFIGCCLMIAACVLFLYNRQEQQRAEIASKEMMGKVVEKIKEYQQDQSLSQENDAKVSILSKKRKMPVVEIDGNDYIGFIEIPSLELKLPVIAAWNEQQLKIAPCRYSGDLYTEDLVIMAHNYRQHFGKLYQLRERETVFLTTMDGNTFQYTVTTVEILNSEDVEIMTAGEYDLTLFTCDYSGNNRVAVRCNTVYTEQNDTK